MQPSSTHNRLGRLLGGLATPRAALLVALVLAFTVLLVVVETRWAPVHRLDQRVDSSLNRTLQRRRGEVTFWKDVSLILHPTVLRIVAVVAVIGLWWRRERLAAVFVAVAMVGEAVIETVAKVLVGRGRPVLLHPLAHASGKSFPSGHAMTALVAFGVLILLTRGRRRAGVSAAAVVLVPLVGFSRLALGVHYLSDVIGAWLLGAAWLLTVHWIFQVRFSDRRLIRGGDA